MYGAMQQQQQQQTFLNQIPEPEQPQEEVQLTELQPVKPSRIRENIFKDVNATDALKALRSFSGDCDDDERFDSLREFNYCKTADHLERPSSKYRRIEVRRKRTGKSRNNVGDTDEERNDDNEGKNARKAQVLRKNSASSNKKKRNEEENGYETHEKSIGKNANADIEFDEDEDEESYSDLEKRDCFKDEVYVYRREPCSNSETEEFETIGREIQQNIHENDCSNTDGNLLDGVIYRKTNLSSNTSCIKDKEKKKPSIDKIDKEKSEKQLKLKIDAIIQENYLLERENNNVVNSNELKAQRKKISLISSVTAPTNAKSSDSSVESEKTERRSLNQDNKQVHYEEDILKKYCCVMCDARFKGNSGLRNHYKVAHGAGPLFKCNECDKEFPLKERLKLHLRTHTGFKPYKCSECDKSFARGSQLVQHRRTHTQVRPYPCHLCSQTFTCSANLALHVKRHKGQKDHKCELCGRAFVRRDALKKHLECLHRDVKSFLCAICNKMFKGHLPQHMRTHVRDRPHGCATCGQRFAQKSQLTVHQRIHSGQRPFRCLVCWQAFAHSTALKLHTRRHTGERPFKCTECKAGFTQLPHWKKHVKAIHGRNDPYGCKRCKSFFRIKSELEKHEKTCHPEIDPEDEGVVSKIAGKPTSTPTGYEMIEKNSVTAKYKLMTVERMRLLLAVLLKRISKPKRLDELGFGKRLIDDVLQDSLVAAGKQPVTNSNLSELESLTRNLEIFLEWTMPKEHWEKFRRMKKTPEDILETLTSPTS